MDIIDLDIVYETCVKAVSERKTNYNPV